MERLRQLWRWSTGIFVMMAAAGYGTWFTTDNGELACLVMVALTAVTLIWSAIEGDPAKIFTTIAAVCGAIALTLGILAEGTVPMALAVVMFYACSVALAFFTVFAAEEEVSPNHTGLRFFQALPLGVGPVGGGAIILLLMVRPMLAERRRKLRRTLRPA